MGKKDFDAYDTIEDGLEEIPEELLDDDEEDGPQTFTVRGRVYEVRFTKKRIDLYEQRHKPIMASFIMNEGAFSTKELSDLMAYGLCKEDGGFVNPRKGLEMAEKLLTHSGYLAVYTAVMEALERDCGFLFQGA